MTVWLAVEHPTEDPDSTPWLPADGEDLCDEHVATDRGPHFCDRPQQHDGRHAMVATPTTGPPLILAAWPGTHTPTEEDL